MVDDVQEGFHRLMDELREAGLAGAYATILAAARNPRHLETLHGMLAPNCRLLRKDFIVLRKGWRRLWHGQGAGGGELPQSAVEELLKFAAPSGVSLGLYYARWLDASRAEIDTRSHDNGWRESVVSGVNPQRGLATHICEVPFLIKCTFLGYQLMVELSVSTNELTEEATYYVMARDRLMRLARNEGRRERWQNGHEVNFILVFDDMNQLKDVTMKIPNGGRVLQASREFCTMLSDLLSRELWFKIDVCRLMPVDRDTPADAFRFTDRSAIPFVACND